MSSSKFRYAGQAEILRAAQKDENYISQLNEITSNLILLGGKKLWLKYASYHIVLSRFLYYACTTLSYLQTLGEEYTGIIPVENFKLLSLKKMIVYVMLLSGGNVVFMNVLSRMEKAAKSDVTREFPGSEHKFEIVIVINFLKNLIPYLERLNKSIFYLNGRYYSFVNRLLGVKHVLFQSWLKDKASLYGFKILAGVSFVNLLASFLHSSPNWFKSEREMEVNSSKVKSCFGSQNSCKLCLNVRKNTSVTVCGHLFCWNCILEWLQYRSDCPLCKGNIENSRIIFLNNYEHPKFE